VDWIWFLSSRKSASLSADENTLVTGSPGDTAEDSFVGIGQLGFLLVLELHEHSKDPN
jgi:hypothetical protein